MSKGQRCFAFLTLFTIAACLLVIYLVSYCLFTYFVIHAYWFREFRKLGIGKQYRSHPITVHQSYLKLPVLRSLDPVKVVLRFSEPYYLFSEFY